MRKTLIVIAAILLFSCSKGDGGSGSCGTYNGHTLFKGSRGGCYYLNSSGVKVYVDRSKCRC